MLIGYFHVRDQRKQFTCVSIRYYALGPDDIFEPMTYHKPTQPTNPTTKRCCGRGGNTCSQFKFQHACNNKDSTQRTIEILRIVPFPVLLAQWYLGCCSSCVSIMMMIIRTRYICSVAAVWPSQGTLPWPSSRPLFRLDREQKRNSYVI